MSLQLYLGGAGSGKTEYLYRDVKQQAKENIDKDYLLIVPEQFTLQTQRDIVTLTDTHGVMNIQILSFLRLAYHVFSEVGGNDYPVLEDIGKSMVLRKLLSEHKQDFVLFKSNLNKPGFIDEVKSFLTELFQYCIQPKDLVQVLDATKDRPVLAGKLKDMNTIYEAFKTYIEKKYITAEEILEVLCEVIEQSEWVKNSIICLDGYTGFTPSQYKLIERLMTLAKKVIVTITIDPRERGKKVSDYQLFSLSIRTIQKLKNLATEHQIVIEEDIWVHEEDKFPVNARFLKSPALGHLEHNLFRYPYQRYVEQQNDIQIYSMQNAKEEVSFVAREIKRLLSEEGYRYRDIAVICGDVKEYSPMIKRVFEMENIPCFIDHKRELLLNPVVELLRAAIAVLEEDYSYESVFRFLKTGLTSLKEDEIEILENYIIATGIRGRKKYHEVFERDVKLQDEIELNDINLLREKVIKDLEPLEIAFRGKKATIKDFTIGMVTFGNELKLPDKIDQKIEEFKSLNQPLFIKEYEQVYRIILDLYDKMVMLLGDDCCTTKEFGEIFESGLEHASVGLIPPGIDTVVVGDTKRTRLNHIKALFFVGVNDGNVPALGDSGGILSDLERDILLKNNMELAPTKKQAVFIEQFYMYLNVTKASNRLYLSYHRLDASGKNARPSYLISKVTQLFQNIKVTLLTIDEDSLNYLCEEDTGLLYLAKELRAFPKQTLSPLFCELYVYYMSKPNTREQVLSMVAGAFARNMESKISEETAKRLYGDDLVGSVTRLEQYAACAFAHFLSYGLNLKERKEYKLFIPDIGNLFHNALDLFSKRLSKSKYDWHTIPEELREHMAIECVQEAVTEYENTYLTSTKRTQYLTKRIERITIKTLWALCQQIGRGSFEPSGYEMPFSHVIDQKIKLTGRIDRLDLYEERDKLYVRVIDYKSGATVFDYSKIYFGLQQQLAVYLSAAVSVLANQHPDKTIVPAGIFYYHIDDPIVERTADYELEILKKLKLSGLVNGDLQVLKGMDKNLVNQEGELVNSAKSMVVPVDINKEGKPSSRSNLASTQEFEHLVQNVEKRLVSDSKDILSGVTKIEPYMLKKHTGCDYCPYKSVCGFDIKLPGYQYQNMEKLEVEVIKERLLKKGDEA